MMGKRSGSIFKKVNYRNGIYQGLFNAEEQTREGMGLFFATDSHMIVGSFWEGDLSCGATFVYYNHSHYVYGIWEGGVPHGINVLRNDKMVIFGEYKGGEIKGKVLIVYEQYNQAVILEKNNGDDGFIEVKKGEIYSDEDFNSYITMCHWGHFDESYKTLIKFLSAHFNKDKGVKEMEPKLRLINEVFYRFGYDEGIAIVFDDEYRIVSSGYHRKGKLVSLGVRFTKENFVEEGNFGKEVEVFAFNYGHRPEQKLQKLYSNYLLRSIDFVNRYLSNPAKDLIEYFEITSKSNFFKKLIAGQITTRVSEKNSPEKMKTGASFDHGIINNETKYNEERIRLKQEKERLETYKKEIFESIKSRSKVDEGEIKELTPEKSVKIISMNPVTLTKKKKAESRVKQKNRSPIFTPEKMERSRSSSISKVSPFKEKMREKIFKQKEKVKHKNFIYEPIDKELNEKMNSRNNSTNKYSSPHEELEFSRENPYAGSEPMIPLSVRKDLAKDAVKEVSLESSHQRRLNESNSHKERKIVSGDNDFDPTFRMNNNDGQKDLINTNVANIVIGSPNRNKSPARKSMFGEAEEFIIKKEGNFTEKKNNNVYLNPRSVNKKEISARKPDSSSRSPQKSRKESNYFDIYQGTKAPSPQKLSQEEIKRRNSNMIPKTYNHNNKVYQKAFYNEGRDEVREVRNERSKERQKRVEFSPETYQTDLQHENENKDHSQSKRKAILTTPSRKKYEYLFN